MIQSQGRKRNKELQREYDERFKEANPESACERKKAQRRRDEKFEQDVERSLFHIRRFMYPTTNIAIPSSVDQAQPCFIEALRRFEAQLMEKVEVEITLCES